MPDGRGWHGDEEGHRKAAKKAERGRFASAAVALWAYVVFLLWLPVRLLSFLHGPAAWIGAQLRGTLANLREALGYLTRPSATLPPSVVSTLDWFTDTVPKLLGLGSTTPRGQVAAAISTIGVALLATFLTGGALVATVVAVLGFGYIGLLRMIPAVNSEYTEWRSALGLDRSGERQWRRE